MTDADNLCQDTTCVRVYDARPGDAKFVDEPCNARSIAVVDGIRVCGRHLRSRQSRTAKQIAKKQRQDNDNKLIEEARVLALETGIKSLQAHQNRGRATGNLVISKRDLLALIEPTLNKGLSE